MSFLNDPKKMLNSLFKKKAKVVINIQTESLKQKVDFVLYNIPEDLLSGIILTEKIFEIPPKENEVFIKATMSPLEIKRQLGAFIFAKKRWAKQEEIAAKLMAEEKIDLHMFYEIYNTTNYMKIYEILNADIFAVYFNNPSMSIDEISMAINNLYIKEFADKTFSAKHRIENLVEKLFQDEKN